MKVIPINKVVKEIRQISWFGSITVDKVLEIIKDNIKEVDKNSDNKTLSNLSYYIWENHSRIKEDIYKEIMKRLSDFSHYKNDEYLKNDK